MSAHEPDRILFAHTSSLSALFVAGQLAHFATADFEPHYAAGWAEGDAPEMGCPTWRLPLVRPPSPLRDLHALGAAVRLLRRLRPTVVHAGTPKAGLVVTAAAWITRRPIRIYAVHGLRFETATGRARQLLRGLERIAMRLATDVIADSASLRDVLITDLGADRAKVHLLGPGSSNGVDTERFRPSDDRSAARRDLGIPNDAVVLGFVGRLTRDKGIDDLVAIHGQLHSNRHVMLLLVGQFEDDDPVDDDTRTYLSDSSDVVRVPWTNQPEAMYTAMDLLVFPSLREGLPNVPLEAQASGVPVVGYGATGTVDAIADRANLVEVNDRDGLRALVDELIDDPARRDEQGRAAREWVTAFDRERVWSARAAFIRDRVNSLESSR